MYSLPELYTGRNRESPKGIPAALLAAWGKWFNAGLRRGMSPPRRMLRASISVKPRENEQWRGHWAQRWTKELREMEALEKRNESLQKVSQKGLS